MEFLGIFVMFVLSFAVAVVAIALTMILVDFTYDPRLFLWLMRETTCAWIQGIGESVLWLLRPFLPKEQ